MMPIADKDIVKLAETFWRVGWHYVLNVGVNTLWLLKKSIFITEMYSAEIFTESCQDVCTVKHSTYQGE